MEAVELSHKEFLKINKDYTKTAEVADLLYVNDKEPGITRDKKGDAFKYYLKGKEVTNEKELERIKKLAIPPAWTNVWICANKNGHIQATGYDARNRKQYRYHTNWNALRNDTKFHHLNEFCKL